MAMKEQQRSVYRSMQGKEIDMNKLVNQNELTVAVGNVKVNARGDQLGAGGKIIKTRAQVLAEKNKLHNGPLADEFEVFDSAESVAQPEPEPVAQVELLQPQAEDTPVAESSDPAYVKPRGSLADSIAQQTEVKQELLDPSIVLGKKTSGPQRL